MLLRGAYCYRHTILVAIFSQKAFPRAVSAAHAGRRQRLMALRTDFRLRHAAQ